MPALARPGRRTGSGVALTPYSWLPSPLPRIPPSRGDIHVWEFELDAPADRLGALERTLSGVELERARRYRSAEDTLRFVVGRGTLRVLLAAYLGLEPQSIQFAQTGFGKLFLASDHGMHKLRFNASGSDGVALIAVALDNEVGIDLERVRDVPDLHALAQQLIDQEALRALTSAPPEAQMREFLEIWVRHESLAKATGLGLRQLRGGAGFAQPLTLMRRDFVASLAATTPFETVTCRSLVY